MASISDDPDLHQIVNRPMIYRDLSSYTDIRFYSDASKAKNLGFGCIFGNNWIFGQWPQLFIEQQDPSIEFLELYALVTGLLTWQDSLVNVRVMVFCDNIAAIHMVNNTTSSCSQCMKLIRILVLNVLKYNRSVRAKFVSTKKNRIADALSRLQIKCFHKLAPDAYKLPDKIDNRMWPVTTKKNYYSIWKVFNTFLIKLDCKPQSWEDRLMLFVGYLVQNNHKSSMVKSYISAIRAVLQQVNVVLQEDRVLLTSLTKACRLRNDRIMVRLPIQKGVLAMLLNEINYIFDNQPFLRVLYRALFSTAYFGLFRVGELTSGDHPVLA